MCWEAATTAVVGAAHQTRAHRIVLWFALADWTLPTHVTPILQSETNDGHFLLNNRWAIGFC